MTSQAVRAMLSGWLNWGARKLPRSLEELAQQLSFKVSGAKPAGGLLFIPLTENKTRPQILAQLARIRLRPVTDRELRLTLECHCEECPDGRLLVLGTNGQSSAWFKRGKRLHHFPDWFTDQHVCGDIVVAISVRTPPASLI